MGPFEQLGPQARLPPNIFRFSHSAVEVLSLRCGSYLDDVPNHVTCSDGRHPRPVWTDVSYACYRRHLDVSGAGVCVSFPGGLPVKY